MALKDPSLILLLAIFSFIIIPSHAIECVSDSGVLVTYWGQNRFEGTLKETCESGNFKIVNLAFLNVFGTGQDPDLDFTGHCGHGAASCTNLASEIQYCQSQGIKVLLSLGGEYTYLYDIPSAEFATEFATYLYDNFLSGQSGPVGSVTLDGIDFFIKHGHPDYVDSLAAELIALRESNNKSFYLSASPNCPSQDAYLGTGIENGRFDYIWVHFYNEQYRTCTYDDRFNETGNLFSSWNTWSSSIPSKSLLFLGIPANPEGTLNGGYIEPDLLKSDVLPTIKQSSNYGGVMLWNRYYDTSTDPSFSDQIRDAVGRECRCVCDDSFAFYGLRRKPM
ncbi:hypothetical protein L6164_026421 [Bauhinia variegata]|uniref:Uncharacterized protein n=1 Tax=Bauhinia variegata TaxID=167791 RepID=A0ACB9LQB6_BAUVA|nr:hypothetical protein L6164_026421 [Bauhinia variegata]